MEILFFSLLFLAVYPYLVYPAAVFILSRLYKNKWSNVCFFPSVSIIISAYNEERVIEEKVKNSLSLKYPEEHLEIIVASDGSKDRTNEIISGLGDPRVILKSFPERLGKTACLNRVITETRGDFVVFTDANSLFPEDVLTKIIRNFSDDQVGGVTGWTKYGKRQEAGDATGLYSSLEKMTKYWESLVSSCVGADGAIFAIRKSLYKKLSDSDINDFVIPLNVVAAGKRVVLDPDVYCFEEPSPGVKKEFQRQARITNRTLRAVRQNVALLNPGAFGIFSFFLLSHKVLKLLVPYFLVGIFIVNLLLLNRSFGYVFLLAVQIGLGSFALSALLGKFEGRFANLCKYFLVTAAAQVIGWIRMIRGISDVTWVPERFTGK